MIMIAENLTLRKASLIATDVTLCCVTVGTTFRIRKPRLLMQGVDMEAMEMELDLSSLVSMLRTHQGALDN